ncbi:hypothetical protein BT96DRAFT_978360 [Gymnopus androsaceus JB14]|uniref:Uncharacterized protein n=1 Tax=Gymnopus androsaceus JB14 TaxID=1447944 RepID=A0A6A4HAH7_9AGAR|nr:hypothetical protein BT96DRAFT_978360 [Gymnopus androsaceus JB14]
MFDDEVNQSAANAVTENNFDYHRSYIYQYKRNSAVNNKFTFLFDTITNTAKERYGEQMGRMSKGGSDALVAFEELFPLEKLKSMPQELKSTPLELKSMPLELKSMLPKAQEYTGKYSIIQNAFK